MPLPLFCMLCNYFGVPAEIVAHTLRDEPSNRHKVVRCPQCGHVQLAPLPTLDEEAQYYARDMQPRSLFGERDYYDILAAKAGMDTMRRLAWLGRTRGPDGTSLLDVGSGYGFYINAASEAGYRATGLEFSNKRCELARTRMKGRFINGEVDEAFAEANRGAYDVVTSFHVVEHLRDPVSYISRILGLVAPGGAVLIEVPNLDDEMTWQIPEYADHQWQVCHLSYFDRSRLELVLRKAGARDFSVEGVQRYGLRHLIRWTDLRSPDLGMPGDEGDSPLLQQTEARYRVSREKAMTCDTLVATIQV